MERMNTSENKIKNTCRKSQKKIWEFSQEIEKIFTFTKVHTWEE